MRAEDLHLVAVQPHQFPQTGVVAETQRPVHLGDLLEDVQAGVSPGMVRVDLVVEVVRVPAVQQPAITIGDGYRAVAAGGPPSGTSRISASRPSSGRTASNPHHASPWGCAYVTQCGRCAHWAGR